ncbi:MAG: SagB/ThcOx family dehydrogenase [Bacteroidota bacterium]|nr:SagB/ThcOx family dehydrogenase [Bacteroidota bacterium]
MNRRNFIKVVPVVAFAAASTSAFTMGTSGTKELQTIILPQPEKEGGKSVLASLQDRKTIRSISSKELPMQVISNLLWAAFGVNRDSGPMGNKGRTAPSASNSQEIDLYVALPAGVYLYDAISHSLVPVVEGDFRARANRRGSSTAPLNIFYIADLSRYDQGPSQPDRSIGDPEVQKSYYYADTGFIAQNIYLFAASFGLAAWFHNCDKVNPVNEFKLKPTQKVLFAQTVGYPG